MDPVPGYEIASWERGYGDFVLRPDLATLRRIPWVEGNALVLCDVAWEDGSPVAPSPRQVLRRQLERLEAHGLEARVRHRARVLPPQGVVRRGARGALPRADAVGAVHPRLPHPRVDATTSRSSAASGTTCRPPGIRVENSKGEAWPGQHEINFHFADALTTRGQPHGLQERREGDRAPRTAARSRSWPSPTTRGSATRATSTARSGATARRRSRTTGSFGAFLAGWIACARELAVFLAPNVNSYKRYAAGSWAPTTLAWGNDNRTCGFRVVGHGRSRRVETRIPGGDVNPYLALAALVAAGLHGIEHGLEPPPALEGNAYESDAERFPSTLREAIAALEQGTMARAAFGDHVVDHYLNYARTEQRLFDEVVTCYERERLFERA